MHDEAATLPTAWQESEGLYHGPFGHTQCVGAVGAYVSSHSSHWSSPPPLMHAEAATLPAAWQGRVRVHVIIIWGTQRVCVQWEPCQLSLLMAAT
jgi:hypothetical protein